MTIGKIWTNAKSKESVWRNRRRNSSRRKCTELFKSNKNKRKNPKKYTVSYEKNYSHTLKEKDDKSKNFILPGSTLLQEMVASKSKEKEQLVKESPTSKIFEDFTKGFGSKMLEKFGWVKGTAINKTLFEYRGFFDGKPVTILKQVKTPHDERRFKLNNDLESLLADDYKEDNDEEKPPFLPASLKWFHLRSFEALLVRNVKGLSISEEPQQDPRNPPPWIHN